ncbi:MAG: cytochrome b/b6 domain-containing protein [Pseudomonadales bacterium]|nr:cytochrome b/b6 domain-containing protein [Pseudomonadales bacterium]
MAPAPSTYTEFSRLLHWLIAALIVLQYVLANLAENAPGDLAELAMLAKHKSVGMTILMLAIVRLGWRFRAGAPPLPATMSRWQARLAAGTHGLLYALLFALPLSGWLLSSSAAFSVSWFNLFSFPDLVSPSKANTHFYHDVHEVCAKLLFLLALLHIIAAVKHAVVDKDGVLRRMLSWVSVGVFVVALAAGILLLGRHDNGATEPVHTSAGEPVAGNGLTLPPSTLTPWTVDSARSEIRFSGDQAGAPFSGTWPNWHGTIRFDPENLSQSQAEIVVDTATPATGNPDRDATMTGSDWFDSTRYPTATYRSADIRADGDGYVAEGELTIRDMRYPLSLRFSYSTAHGEHILDGSTSIDRLAIGLGTGDWVDTSWVGQMVPVTFHVIGR